MSSLENVVGPDELCDRIDLETYVSPNFMGLFVKDADTKWLIKISTDYVDKLTSLGVTAKAQVKSLHLTLAYQFPSNLFQPLRSMVENLEPTKPNNWELRLYSRDPRLQNSHVHKVIHSYTSKEHDDLELRVGDYVYIPEGACDASTDGWIEGTSWLTGTSGHLPLNHTKRTAESDSWTLHTTVQINNKESENIEEEEMPKERKPLLYTEYTVDMPDGIDTNKELVTIPLTSRFLYRSNEFFTFNSLFLFFSQKEEASSSPKVSARQIFICRHGERVDFTFGAWIPYCFEENGCYVRRDLNMPKEIPLRNIRDFQNDSPLTTVGEVQAGLVGEAMKSSNVKIDVAFTSPSLRCVQTLSHILKGLDLDIPMKIEPGLIEWLAWYPNGIPVWMTSEELINAGFNVDKNYNQIIQTKDLPLKENAAQYYERSYDLIKRIIESTVGNILIVAHAASLAACTKQLTGGQIPSAAEVTKLVQRVPYLACLAAREGLNGWQLYPPPFPPITHTSNSRFDWKVLM